MRGAIFILSGEGDRLTIHPYTGKRTDRAIAMRLKRERSNGQRTARAYQIVGYSELYSFYECQDLDSGDVREFDAARVDVSFK